MIYFDNAATTFPKPKRVEMAMLRAITRYGANPGRAAHNLAMETAGEVYKCREAVAELFNVKEPENVVFCLNTTHAINLAVKGILRRGDHVIISDLEHNAVLRPIHALAQAGLISYCIAQTFDDDELTLRSIARLIRPNTRLITITHASNAFGISLPIEKIADFAYSQGILLLVDAAQTAGLLDIDMSKACIDFLCMPGHKSLYGPMGTGVLITPLGSALGTIIEGGTGSFSADFCMPSVMPDRLECGTSNVPGILGLGAGVSFVTENTPRKIYDHSMRIGVQIFSALRRMPNVELYTNSFEMGKHLPVIAFNISGMHSEEAAALLNERGFALRAGIQCSPLAHQKMGTQKTGTVRISIGAFNNPRQADMLCHAIGRL